MSDTFTSCQSIHKLIESGDDDQARDQLIQLLDTLDKESQPRNELVNHLTRSLGLYQYIDPDTAIWQDRLAHEAFQADIGGGETKTMHRDQSHLLKMLLEGKDIAVSAPTSFGKSFVIDAFISIREPQNVVIIVPTIALMDETRRRLTRKFSSLYKIVTTSDSNLEERNILIFPQERALSYLKDLDSVDLLIVDEFYKASNEFKSSTDGRSSLLLNVILKFSKIAKQRYFLAPNISSLKENIFTKGMKFHEFKMSTVYLKTNEEYRSIKGSAGEKEKQKTDILLELLTKGEFKTNTLIYAGTYSEVEKVSNIIIKDVNYHTPPLLIQFSKWIKKNYSPNWNLSELVKRGTGIHNGRIPRSLAQIQIKLFEKSENGLENIISTSSIIEGVNTSAERVVLWKNKNGNPRIKSFDYKNLIGRGGRMFQYFVGHIHVLEEPPASVETQLTLDVPDEILVTMDDTEQAENQLTDEQIGKIIAFKEELKELLNSDQMQRLLSGGYFNLWI